MGAGFWGILQRSFFKPHEYYIMTESVYKQNAGYFYRQYKEKEQPRSRYGAPNPDRIAAGHRRRRIEEMQEWRALETDTQEVWS